MQMPQGEADVQGKGDRSPAHVTSSSGTAAVGKDLHEPASDLALFSHGVAEVPLEY